MIQFSYKKKTVTVATWLRNFKCGSRNKAFAKHTHLIHVMQKLKMSDTSNTNSFILVFLVYYLIKIIQLTINEQKQSIEAMYTCILEEIPVKFSGNIT